MDSRTFNQLVAAYREARAASDALWAGGWVVQAERADRNAADIMRAIWRLGRLPAVIEVCRLFDAA